MLNIEVHASKVYKGTIFVEVQHEIKESIVSCFHMSKTNVNGTDIFIIMEGKDPFPLEEKRINIDNEESIDDYDVSLSDNEFKTFWFAEMDNGIDSIAIDVFSSVENTINHLSVDKPKFEEYLKAMKELNRKFIGGLGERQDINKSDELDVLLGVDSSIDVDVENPKDIRNKCCGTRKILRCSK
ncbi:hypothetical protein L1887_39234 [Cichorium endivia]|nr:hypothetical protein L1887_39234 [Cichorium endivia]